MKTYKVNEVFHSIQGEGSWVGTPMVFVRFSGCNLKCHFCDTEHESGVEMTEADLIARIVNVAPVKFGPVGVCFTGGEPCIQLTESLLQAVDRLGFKSHLETNGTLPVPAPQMFRCITYSPKGVLPFTRRAELLCEPIQNRELKIVWDETQDNLEKMIHSWSSVGWNRMFIQPMDDQGETNLDEVLKVIKSSVAWSLSVQLHKMLGIC